MSGDRTAEVVAALRARGHRMTPQRLAIVSEIVATEGHISAQEVAARVRARVPGVNDSTVYRTLDLLEAIGVLAHSHLGSGPAYHHADEAGHVHFVCARCRSTVDLARAETAALQDAVVERTGFLPDFTHFAVSGLCAACRAAEGGHTADRTTPPNAHAAVNDGHATGTVAAPEAG